SVPQKLDRLLDVIAKKTKSAGQFVTVDHLIDGPIIGTRDDKEFHFLCYSLVQIGDLERAPVGNDVRISIQGWRKLQPFGINGMPGLGFIAMSFDPSLNHIYETMKAAVLECNLPEPIRVDRIHHNEKICDRILSEIARC